tara:strand:- start:905 stop:4222 length:3318 start_codon:yes stop_codon:yes gene_type:complete
MIDNYSFLIDKLDKFIRKFYVNRLIKGILFTTAIILIFFLIIVLAENQFYFSGFTRKILFFSFIISTSLTFILLVLKPLFKLNKLGSQISHKQAAEIIGTHFVSVQDKLLNILQLKETALSLLDASLIEASIKQKSEELRPIPFTSAINIQENKIYLKYIFPPLILFLALLFFKPSLLKDSTNRLVKNNIEFEKPKPFEFIISSNQLTCIQFDDFKLNIEIVGEELPDQVFIIKNNLKYTTQKFNAGNYAYVFTNLQDDVSFHLEAAGFKSKEFRLDVKQKPLITNFQLKIDYPNYVGLKNETILNNGDISVPEGSKITWLFNTQATDKISMQFSDALIIKNNPGNNQFIFNKTLKNNEIYIIKTINMDLASIDSSVFNIRVIYDDYPEIELVEYVDSANNDIYFYVGNVLDDYGLSTLNFVYTITDRDGEQNIERVRVPILNGTASEFSYYWNIKEMGLEPGSQMNYYFEVYDNDQVNGRKSTKSKWMTLTLPSLDEMEEESEREIEEIKEELKESISASKDLQEEFKELKEELLQNKEMSWEIKKKLEDLLNQQKSLQNKVENLKKKFDTNTKKQAEFKTLKPEIKKKQEQIRELFDAVLDEETKAMIEKLEKLMQEMNKEEAIDKMEELQVSDEDLENELDRMLELLKKLELEQKLQETIDKLKELAREQEKLAEKSSDKDTPKEDLEEKQEELNEQFDELKKDLEDIQEEGEDFDMDEAQDQAEKVDKEMDNAKQELSKGKKQKAAEIQKELSKKMEKLAESLGNMMAGMQMAGMEEDMESLRQLLENLVVLSLDEERILSELKKTAINTPKYISLVQDQFKLIDDSEMVEDSLYALAKRVFEMQSFIIDEIQKINKNLDKAVNQLEERKVNPATVNQQYVMTGYNNLALMLSEVMEQMQKQMAQQMEGDQMCENPGSKPGGKPGKIPSLKQMQQQLSDKISEMSKMPGKGEAGSQAGQSKKLAEMAAKQQAIRQALEKLNQSENKDGQGSLGELQEIIDQMEQNEADLVNKRLTQDLINRQKDILTRLLEAETAERERDEKEERESITARQYNNVVPPSLEEYIKKQKGSVELYKKIPPKLKPFYRVISEKYVQNIFKIN